MAENDNYERSRSARQVAGDVALTAAFNKVADAVNGLINSVTQAFSFVDKTQKASLALGQTLNTTRDRLGDSLDGLRGSIEQKLTAGIMTLDEGLRGNNAGVAKLINQQMLTGTTYANTAKAFSKLQNTLGLSNDQTNKLAETIKEEGNRQGVATDVLVNAIDSLKNDFGKFRVLGLQDVPEIMAMGVARFGKANADQFSKALGFLLDTSQRALSQRAALGIAGIDEQIRTASTTSARFELAIDAINKAGVRFSDIAGRGSRTFDAFNSVIGPAGTSLAVLAEAGQQAAQNLGQADYSQQIGVRFDEALNIFKEPLMEFAIESFPYILAGITTISEQASNVVDTIVQTYEKIGGIQGIFETIKNGLLGETKWLMTTLKVIGMGMLAYFLFPMANVALGIVTAFSPVLGVAALVVGAFVAISAIIASFSDKMSTMQIIIDSVMFVFNSLKYAIGKLVAWIGDWVSDDLEEMGNKMADSALAWRREMETRGFGVAAEKDEDEGPGFLEKLTMAFDDNLNLEKARFNVEQDSNSKLGDIEANTREAVTNDFQERSYQSIAESIDRILGVDANPNERLEELLEEANLIAAANLEKDPTTNIQQGALA